MPNISPNSKKLIKHKSMEMINAKPTVRIMLSFELALGFKESRMLASSPLFLPGCLRRTEARQQQHLDPSASSPAVYEQEQLEWEWNGLVRIIICWACVPASSGDSIQKRGKNLRDWAVQHLDLIPVPTSGLAMQLWVLLSFGFSEQYYSSL